MQQKVAVAVAFIRNTPILFLDEPTLGLDVESSIELRRTLKELASENLKTVLISSHDMKVVEEICERVIILKNGRIIANDRIPNLKSLFRTIAYKVVYEGILPEELKEKLKGSFLNVTFGKMDFVVEFKRMEDIYDFMNLLRAYKIQIKSLKAVEPDFERVYIELIKGGK
jgi:ABC-2 type transport system ATP-binding protein